MKILWHSHMTKSSRSTKFQPNWLLHVSGTSRLSFWTRLVSCKATILNLGPFLSKFHRIVVLPNLNLPDITLGSYHFSVDPRNMVKFAARNLLTLVQSLQTSPEPSSCI